MPTPSRDWMPRPPSPRDRATSGWIHPTLVILIVAVCLGVPALVVVFGSPREAGAVVARSRSVAAELRGQGRLSADEVATVGADAPGRIEALLAREGEAVQAGALLARLDGTDARHQVRAAEAALKAAEEATKAARHDLGSAKLRLDEVIREYERIAPLAGTAVPRVEVDAAADAVPRAETDLGRATARVEQAAAEASVARTDLARARDRAADLELRAPVDGVVVARAATAGDVVAAGSSIFRIADPASLRITATFDESVLPRLRPGLPAAVSFYSDPDREYEGRIDRIGREVDDDTREVEVVLALERTPESWAVGQRVDVRVRTDPGKRAVTIDSGLVTWRDGVPGVLRLSRGRARWTPIVLGRSLTSVIVEIDEGVVPGDTLIVPDGVRENARVRPRAVDLPSLAISDSLAGGSR